MTKIKYSDIIISADLSSFLKKKGILRKFKNRCTIDNPDVIIDAFDWSSTPEGFEYWNKLSDEYGEYMNHLRTKATLIKYKDVILNSTLHQFLKNHRLLRKFRTNCVNVNTPYANSISMAFIWKNTPEGKDYWEEVSRKYIIYKRKYEDNEKDN